MADQVTTSGEFGLLVPQIWSRRAYDTLLAELPFSALINRVYEGEARGLGDTVKITSFAEFSPADIISEDQRADADDIPITQQSLVMNKIIVKDFILSNKLMLQSLPFVDQLRDRAIYAINKSVEALVVANIVPAVSNAINYDSGTTLQLADALEAKELLDAANVPLEGRHMVAGPAQWNDLFNITGFTSSDFLLSGAPLQTGAMPPMLLGFIPHMSTAVGNTSYWFHESFMAIATQGGVNVKQYDLGVQGFRQVRINVDMLMGIKQLDNTRVVSIS